MPQIFTNQDVLNTGNQGSFIKLFIILNCGLYRLNISLFLSEDLFFSILKYVEKYYNNPSKIIYRQWTLSAKYNIGKKVDDKKKTEEKKPEESPVTDGE